MADELLSACLRLPTLRRDHGLSSTALEGPELARVKGLRERDEAETRDFRIEFEKQRNAKQGRGDVARRDELERSILATKEALKEESLKFEGKRALGERVAEALRGDESVMTKAAVDERDRLAVEILNTYRLIARLDMEEETLRAAQAKIVRGRNEEGAAMAKRRRVRKNEKNDEERKPWIKEKSALQKLFVGLILESGADWVNNKDLSDEVWSHR